MAVFEAATRLHHIGNVDQETVRAPTDNDILYWDNTAKLWKAASATGIGGAAPDDAQYVTLATSSNLDNERVLTATANETSITDNGAGSTVDVGIADNPVLPGTTHTVVPTGTTAQETGTTDGGMRYNSTTSKLRARQNGTWHNVMDFIGGPDAPSSYSGSQFQFATVNEAEDSLEFTEFSLENITKTASYSMADDDSVILADATAGAMTVTLPRPSDVKRRVVTIKKIDTTGNVVTIATV